MRALWHRLLCFLKIRDDFDYAPPFAPEVNHPYEKDEKLNCCTHCGAGKKHAVHSEPYDQRRVGEIMAQHKREELSGWYEGEGFVYPPRER